MIRNYFKPVENIGLAAGMPPTKKRGVENTAAPGEPVPVAVALETMPDGPDDNGRKSSSCAAGETGAVQKQKDVEDTEEAQIMKKIEANKLAARKRLIESQQLKLEKQTMAEDWYTAFLPELHKPYFLAIKQALNKELQDGRVIYPALEEIYSFTRCSLKDVRVVIIGQDPYHGPNQAHGLCFSVKKGVPPPPSLNNIFRELETDLGNSAFTRPNHGSLEGWCSEGVLLLNAGLTVRKGEPNSHKHLGWATFTDAIIAHLDKTNMPERDHGLVFMLWGAFAQKKGAKINRKKHLVLTAKHPSPLSANQGGWFGCKHFSKANVWLKEKGVKEINWNHLP
ncbi:hypothetical protein PhCBS80983_g03067 [Powellomyces hirtus]|uniref:Uracil-DNA glycosylase n=1 Tax=Powellomyces hirtus TaxID=109895 RepID=A0A507E568_9FUNG|nr:hypothetical protein PhCBS80983_g03067 [Powellomyces hirtus]